MRTRAATYFTSRVAPWAVEAIQTLAGAALLTSLCLLVARFVVPDLVYSGLISQLASPVSIGGLLLLTVATVLLERELTWHGLGIGASETDKEGVVEVAIVADRVERASPSRDRVPAAEPVVELPETVTVAAIKEPTGHVISLPETPVLQLVGHADPPEPRAMPIEDDPWWMPWMDRGRRSVFDGAPDGPRPDSLHRELADQARADTRPEELVPAA